MRRATPRVWQTSGCVRARRAQCGVEELHCGASEVSGYGERERAVVGDAGVDRDVGEAQGVGGEGEDVWPVFEAGTDATDEGEVVLAVQLAQVSPEVAGQGAEADEGFVSIGALGSREDAGDLGVCDADSAKAQRAQLSAELCAQVFGIGMKGQGDVGDRGIGGDGEDAGFGGRVVANNGFAGLVRAHVPGIDGDLLLLGELYGRGMQDFGPGPSQRLHALVRDLGDPASIRDFMGIGRVDTIDVGVDLTVRAESRRESDGSGIGTTAAERGDLTLVADTLKSSDDDDVPGRELVLDPKRSNLDDPGATVLMVGDDAALRTRETDRLVTARVDGNGQQRHGLAFASAEQHVELAEWRILGEGVGLRQQPVGGLAHRRDHDDDRLGLGPGHNAGRNLLQAVMVGDAATAKFHDNRSSRRR